MKTVIIFLGIIISTNAVGQVKSNIFSPNNLEVSIKNNGQLFNNNVTQFKKGFTRKDIEGSALLQAGILLAGNDIGSNSKFAISELDDWHNEAIFSPGMVDFDINYLGVTDFYRVTKNDILKHIEDYDDNGIIDDPIGSIYGWPGKGNPYFESIHGVPIHDFDKNLNIAPYYPNSQDVYDPSQGHFPFQTQKGRAPEEEAFPDEMIFFITSNRFGNVSFNVGYLLYGFSCPDNPLIDNTLFLELSIQYCGFSDLFCSGINFLFDSSFGNGGDDDIVSIPEHDVLGIFDTEIDENAPQNTMITDSLIFLCKNIIGGRKAIFSNGLDNCSYPYYPDSLISARMDQTGYRYLNSENPILKFHFPGDYFFNFHKNRWGDGTPLTFGGNGYNPTSIDTVDFIFQGNIYNGEGWTSRDAYFEQNDRKVVAHHSDIKSLQPDEFMSITYGLSLLTHNKEHTIYAQLDSLENLLDKYYYVGYLHDKGNMCGDFLSDVINPVKLDFKLFPNPSNELINLESSSDGEVYIIDLVGNTLIRKPIQKDNRLIIDIADFNNGVYLIKIHTKNGIVNVQKLIKS